MAAIQTALATPELLAMIFSNLKEKKTKWKGAAARLAAVSQGFFYASIATVWEDMHSFEPFCPLFFPQRPTGPNAPRSSSGAPYSASARFELRPPLALHRSIRVIQFLSIYLDPSATTQGMKDAILELTSCVAQHNNAIRFLDCTQPGGLRFLGQGPMFESLQTIQVTVSPGELEAMEPILWAPTRVAIAEASGFLGALLPGYVYEESRDHCVAAFSVQKSGALCYDLRELSLRGTSGFLEMLGRHPCKPTPAQQFDRVAMEVVPGGPDEVPVTPTIIARYITANPGLTLLVARATLDIHQTETYPYPVELPRIRSDPGFLAAQPLLSQFMASPNLKHIHLEKLYFPGGDIILRMLQLLVELPQLESFSLLPYPLSHEQVDTFTYPSLACLVDVSLRCTSLITFKLTVDLQSMQIPDLRPDSPHNMSVLDTLILYPSPTGLPTYSMAESMDVAMYLYELFPNLEILTDDDWVEADAKWKFWNDIDLIVGGLQDIRERTLQMVGITVCPSPFKAVLFTSQMIEQNYRNRFSNEFQRWKSSATCSSTPDMSSSAPKATPALQVLETPELLAIVFAFLEVETVSEAQMDADDGEMRWKRRLVPLATVNSSFFRATSDLLWEEMDSLRPFLAILNPSHADRGSMDCDDGISAYAWTRFELYASRTRSITLDHAGFHSCWALYISISPHRPHPLFPTLRELTLGSGDSMPLLIALSSYRTIQRLRIKLPMNEDPTSLESVAALTASLAENAKQLRSISLIHPVDVGIIRNVSKISSLRHIYIHVRTGGAAQIIPLLRLDDLESLDLKIDPCEADHPGSDLLGDGALSEMLRCPPHPSLRHLTIAADTNSQIAVVAILGSTVLKSLRMTICYTGSPHESSQAVPLVLAAYLARSPHLTSLVVASVCSFKHPTVRRGVVASAQDWTPQFFAHLSSKKSLDRLDFTGLLLPTPDFAVKLFRLLPEFPKLRRFRFTQHSASSYIGPWIFPAFEDLKQIPLRNPRLASLTMPIDSRSPIPEAPAVGSLAMKSLTLHLYPNLRNQLAHDSSLAVSLFLDQLFPCIQSLNSNFEPASPQKSVWKPIKQMVDAYQLVRARAVQNVGIFSSP
ncbi:hypothetical protein NMY22_g14486 [Coprinellus aureogranulatus]|nr:hypothetical protein NMY22_g14486 [Coprinellus aureogranulatus]